MRSYRRFSSVSMFAQASLIRFRWVMKRLYETTAPMAASTTTPRTTQSQITSEPLPVRYGRR